MLSFIQDHPFAVEAFFETSTVLTFAVEKGELEHLIPECLTLDTFQDKWAFIAIAMVQTKELRPKGFPKFMGNDFFLIGYRIFVRYKNQTGKSLRGLYIIKSETDNKTMEIFGNIFTHYHYTTTDISRRAEGKNKIIQSHKSDFLLSYISDDIDTPLPLNSPFDSWKEARQFAGPLPNTFTYDASKKEILIIEGVRKNWTPKPLKINSYHFHFLNTLELKRAILANAFSIENIPYYWKRGRKEKIIQ